MAVPGIDMIAAAVVSLGSSPHALHRMASVRITSKVSATAAHSTPSGSPWMGCTGTLSALISGS